MLVSFCDDSHIITASAVVTPAGVMLSFFAHCAHERLAWKTARNSLQAGHLFFFH